MSPKDSLNFKYCLNAISSSLAHKILRLYSKKKEGLNLTDTASSLDEPISTIQDHLKKLLDSSAIYLKSKKYYLSSYGNYILHQLEEIKQFNDLSGIFGQIPADMIPHQLLKELVPNLTDVDLNNNSWHFFQMMEDFFNDFKENLKSGKINLKIKVLGWWDIDMDFEILQTHFKDLRMDSSSVFKFFKNITFKIVSDKNFAEDLTNHDEFREVLDYFKDKDYMRICEDVVFNFTMMRYENTFILFLTKDGDMDYAHHYYSQDEPHVLKFFEQLFDHYWSKSVPSSEFYP